MGIAESSRKVLLYSAETIIKPDTSKAMSIHSVITRKYIWNAISKELTFRIKLASPSREV